jgi:glycosyltransferase involved in cell wall biosynthesis
MKPRICFFITDTHIPYSPTILGLHKLLSESFDIDILIFDNRNMGIQKVDLPNIFYITPRKKRFDIDFQIYTKLIYRNDNHQKIQYNDYVLIRDLKHIFLKNNYRFIIAVDIYALFIAQNSYNGTIHFISLELHYNIDFIKNINPEKINSIVIQRRDRYEYLFPKYEIKKIFYIQNTTFYKEKNINFKNRDPFLLLHAGTSQDIFGIYAILNFISKNPAYKIYLKGSCCSNVKQDIHKLYNDEFYTGRIIIDEIYEKEDEITDFISQYYIGLCFYDLSYDKANNFNYLTAPSGKMFKYLAAGVPVIGSDIPGLSLIKEYEAGELITDLSSRTILHAINKIKDNYDMYANNAIKLSRMLSFDKISEPYINFLKSDEAS